MLCERCKKNLATVHMKKNINGEKAECYLCEECAISIDHQLSFDQFFQGFLDTIFNSDHAIGFSGMPQKHVSPACKICGLTYSEFREHGKLGCVNCYDTFKDQLDIIFKNIHGSNRHQGKFPHRKGAILKRKRDIETLKTSLMKAIEAEEYEQAAQLRDRIREIERNGVND